MIFKKKKFKKKKRIFFKAKVISLFIISQPMTSPSQQSLKEVGYRGIIGDFFDIKHANATMFTLVKKRQNNCRLLLWTFLAAIFFFAFTRDEKLLSFLYTRCVFQWNHANFSNFRIFQATIYMMMLLCGMPIMKKLFKWKDTSIGIIGALSSVAARVVLIFAKTPMAFYIGGAISCLAQCIAPILRSMTTKIVPFSERGKVLALFSLFANVVSLFSSILYSNVYNWTIGKFAGIFALTAIVMTIEFFLML